MLCSLRLCVGSSFFDSSCFLIVLFLFDKGSKNGHEGKKQERHHATPLRRRGSPIPDGILAKIHTPLILRPPRVVRPGCAIALLLFCTITSSFVVFPVGYPSLRPCFHN
mmetsp:Transcript_7513/g.23195  ORF Transcript_7513/g.23195 Transcript_7513/m.23195 type:complete len:109 (+) Transcript_7513:995-1321(+)